MKKEDDELGFFSGYGAGGRGMNPVYGAFIGAGGATIGILGAKAFTRKSSNWSKYAGAVGMATGGIPSLMLVLSKNDSTKKAGYLGLAIATIEGLTELIKTLYIEPKQLMDSGYGLYQPEMTGAGEDQIAILGDDYYSNWQTEVDGAGMAAPIEILGETTPAAALGAYQTEMTGAHPLDVMGAMGAGGFSPYSGHF